MEYISIGHTKKTHGIVGELKVSVKDAYLVDFAQSDVLFLDIRGKPTPFFVEEIRTSGDLLVKFEDVATKEAAQALVNREISMRRSDLRTMVAEVPSPTDYMRYTGYLIEDATLGVVGRIRELVELPEQVMAMVERDGREVMVPINASFLKRADHQALVLRMDLPEGLLDL